MDRRLALGVAVLLAGAGLAGTGVGPAAADSAANVAPVGVPDTFTVEEGETLEPDASVLDNDTDGDDDDLSAEFVKGNGPANGSVTFDSNGYFVFTPNEDFHGTDSFTYKADDGTATSALTKVTVTVTAGPNAAPKAVDDSYTVAKGGTLTLAAPGILANDTDADDDALRATVVSKPKHGLWTFKDNGEFTYTPTEGYTGTDTWTYKASDGDVDSAPATVSIKVGSGTPPAPCAATVSIANAPTVTEGNSGTRKMVFPVKASNLTNCGALTVKLKVSGGTAKKTTDYTSPSATLVLPAGKATGSISVSVKGDKTYEPNETVSLTLTSVSAPAGSPKLGTVKGTGTIKNDDKRP